MSPPPLAWLAAPLNSLSEGTADALWITLVALALFACAALAGRGWTGRLRYSLLLVLTWATALAIVSGNVVALVGLAAVVAARLASSGHHVWSGAILTVTSIKPQVVLALPLLLLASGNWRVVATWAGGTILLALVALLSVGAHGLQAYLDLVSFVGTFKGEQQLSLSGLTANPVAAAALAVGAAAAFVWVAARFRQSGPVPVFGLGLLASLTLSPYLNLEDYCLLPVAAMLLLRDWRIAWPGAALLVAIALSATPASQGLLWPTFGLIGAFVAFAAATAGRLSPPAS